MIYLTATACSFMFVFLKAFQQRNVAFDNYLFVLPTSYGMAFVEVYIIAMIVRQGADMLLVLAIGTGAGFGALIAMVLHKRYIKK